MKNDTVFLKSEDFELITNFIEFVKHAPVYSGVCCCGDNMDSHADPYSCGHTPVDVWDHSLYTWLQDIENISPEKEINMKTNLVYTNEKIFVRFITEDLYRYGNSYSLKNIDGTPALYTNKKDIEMYFLPINDGNNDHVKVGINWMEIYEKGYSRYNKPYSGMRERKIILDIKPKLGFYNTICEKITEFQNSNLESIFKTLNIDIEQNNKLYGADILADLSKYKD